MITNRELLNSLSNEELADIIFHDDIKSMASDGDIASVTYETILDWLRKNVE